MSYLGFGYRREGDRIYWKHSEVTRADVQSFAVLNDIWARDQNRVYVYGQARRKIDPQSFQVLDSIFAKDRNRIWTLEGCPRRRGSDNVRNNGTRR